MNFRMMQLLMVLSVFMYKVNAEEPAHVTYLGNAGLMVDHEQVEILFDPFFHNHYGYYQLVPESLRNSLFGNKAPFDSIEMILVSHAHGDHFDAKDIADYLIDRPNTKLVAPAQAVEVLRKDERFKQFEKQVTAIKLAYGDEPVTLNFTGLEVDVLRIPHSGWPSRAEVANLVYRVTLNDQVTVMHMGDADVDDDHFKPWAEYWAKQMTDTAFPPYWFMLDPRGQQLLSERINAKHAIGVHVPVDVPKELIESGADYFFETGKTIDILITKNKEETSNDE
ncbi:MAG: MBL fold metallo-hydrolase [Marinicella sp.]